MPLGDDGVTLITPSSTSPHLISHIWKWHKKKKHVDTNGVDAANKVWIYKEPGGSGHRDI